MYASHDRAAAERKKPLTQTPKRRNAQRERYAVCLYRTRPSSLLIPICRTGMRPISSSTFDTVERRTGGDDWDDVFTEVCVFFLSARLNKLTVFKWCYT